MTSSQRNLSIDEYIVFETDEVKVLINTLNKKVNVNFGSGFALIVNANGELVGTITDSDLRKFIGKDPGTQLAIKEIMRTDFISVDWKLNQQEVIEKILEQMNLRGWSTSLPVELIPVTKQGKPISLLDLNELDQAIHLKKDKNVIIGLGYVGLTLGLSLAHLGRNVYGIDDNKQKVDLLNKCESYVMEPGIENLLKNSINRNFTVLNSSYLIPIESGVRNIYFICVGTPLDENQVPSLNYIWTVLKDLLSTIKNGDAIVMRSTVPIGTGSKIVSFIEDKLSWKVGSDFHYISAPERTVEGNALNEIRELPQLIAGATESCQILGVNIFQSLSKSVTPLSNIESAELVKLMGNSYRDYMFGFANYFIKICQGYNLDINLLIESSNTGYPRSNIAAPSMGVGGPCLTKDPYFFQGYETDEKFSPILAARKTNESIPAEAVNFISRHIGDLNDLKCLAIGIAFKGIPETNDIRNSPAVDFLSILNSKVKSIKVWDTTFSAKNEYLDFPVDSTEQNYNFYAILNNNPKNVEYFNLKIKSHLDSEIVIYDPWRLLNPEYVKVPDHVRYIHYLSLSHYEKKEC
jgi:UDP-N-acetyl-D-mannosaminuronic acid dehydrogenase